MKKSWGLIPKILDGRKKIESRWGINRCAPWGRVKIGDTVYFKDAGGPIIVKVNVLGVKGFENLTPDRVREILERYGGEDGIVVVDLEKTIQWAKKKRYCTLIYLDNPQKIEPFEIDKKGFGGPAAWLTVKDINQIKKK